MRLSLFSTLAFVAIACGGTQSVVSEPEPVDPIRLPVSLYVVVSEAEPELSSQRTVAEVEAIGVRVAEIWAEAGVDVEIGFVGEIDVPPDVIRALIARDGRAFLIAASEGRFEVPNPGAIVGFYTRDAGGVNGFAPFGQRAFFVTDEPTVFDERVSSHEIGHILGLHHELVDDGRLMFSGTNGMQLTAEEATVARYSTQGMIDGAR